MAPGYARSFVLEAARQKRLVFATSTRLQASLLEWNEQVEGRMTENAMADPAAYTWFAAFQTAVLGTGPGSFGSRIAAAFTLIQERLNSSPAVDDAEHREIEGALLVLHALRAEIAP
jgi:hypothetical protein